MDRYTILFVFLLTIRGLKGQFMTANIRGPILLGNAKSFNGKGTSVVNIVNGYEVNKDHFLNSEATPFSTMMVANKPTVYLMVWVYHSISTLATLEAAGIVGSLVPFYPVVAAHDKEPAVITHQVVGYTKPLSAVNVIKNYDKDPSFNHRDLKKTVINGGVSSDKADDYSVVKHLYYENAKDGDDDTDIDIEDEENEDY